MIEKENYPRIPITKIDIEEKWNVRTLEKEKKIDELKESLLEYDLLQPIVVFQEGDRFKLIIGQRRLRAFKELKKEGYSKFNEIPAVILPKKPDEEKAKILSLSENIHRVELNRADIVEVIGLLYRKYNKSAKKVAKVLGKSISYIYEYLKVEDAPGPIKKMYYEKKIGRDDVRRLMEMTSDKTKMTQIAKEMVKEKLTRPQKERLPEVIKHLPEASAEQLIKEVKKPKIEEKIIVPLSPELIEALDIAVKDVGLGREEIAKKALEEWLSEKGYYKK